MVLIISILKMLVISYVLKDFFSFIGDLLLSFNIKWKWLNLIRLLLSYLLTCSKCSTMWLVLIMSGDLFIAAGLSIVITIIEKLEKKYSKTIL